MIKSTDMIQRLRCCDCQIGQHDMLRGCWHMRADMCATSDLLPFFAPGCCWTGT
jgi:hypothetical protein